MLVKQKKYHIRSIRTIAYLMTAGLVAVGTCVRAMFRIPYLINKANRSSSNINNRSRPTTRLPLMATEGDSTTAFYATTYTPPTQEQFIIDAIEQQPADLVPNGRPHHLRTLKHPRALDNRVFKRP